MDKKTNPKVSVVIPVYNVELYLREALESVVNQSLKEIEIILINDGSTDNSLEIIKEYSKKDERIKVITQSNSGLSVTRNRGLEKACGKYIYFMDSDDYIELTTLELCYKKAEKEKLDFVFFDALPFTDENFCVDINSYNREKLQSDKVKTGQDFLKELIAKGLHKSPVWLNFINRKYLMDLNLKFYPNILHEDELFSFILFLYAKKISYINQKFFKRRMRKNSIMTSTKNEKNTIGYLTVAAQLNLYKEKEKEKEKIKLLNYGIQRALSGAIYTLNYLDSNTKEKYYHKIKKEKLSLKNTIKLILPGITKQIKQIREYIK
jgi:glycosyltransferase involved in cell wall biosynthesis